MQVGSDNDLDRSFRDKLEDFEIAPAPAMWDRIERSLDAKPPKRRGIPMLWTIAASIVIVLGIGVGIFSLLNKPVVEQAPIAAIKKKVNELDKTTDPDALTKAEAGKQTIAETHTLPKDITGVEHVAKTITKATGPSVLVSEKKTTVQKRNPVNGTVTTEEKLARASGASLDGNKLPENQQMLAQYTENRTVNDAVTQIKTKPQGELPELTAVQTKTLAPNKVSSPNFTTAPEEEVKTLKPHEKVMAFLENVNAVGKKLITEDRQKEVVSLNLGFVRISKRTD